MGKLTGVHLWLAKKHGKKKHGKIEEFQIVWWFWGI